MDDMVRYPVQMRADFFERLLRFFYSITLYILVPITLYHLIWRGFRQRAYFQRWDERYASYSSTTSRAPLWLHAVSVGEVNAAAPLVNALLKQRPDLPLVVTTITPTGSERVRTLWGNKVTHVYLPYDLPGAVSRFLQHFKPAIALIVETELWPNLLFGCRDRGIPTYIVNARLSARSLRGYRVLAPLLRRALSGVSLVAAQSKDDAARFLKLGAPAERVSITGNLKFDMLPIDNASFVAEFKQAFAAQHPIWIAASTHEEEEAIVLDAHRQLREQYPDALLLWAPRHPERFQRVAQQARDAGFDVTVRSQAHWPTPTSDVFVIDTLGELLRFYACAQVAFVGGSLQAIGGHNLLEPAATGTAILSGPQLHNFVDIARRLREVNAMRMVQDASTLADAVAELLRDTPLRQQMTANAAQLLEDGRGALARTLSLIEPVLPD
jgi:3-deoxy-D-manno-octulosonic-acid transferase